MVRGLRALIELSAVAFLAVSCFAQVGRSGLTGTVTDPSGRVLAETHITAVQNSTQLQRETVSDSTGNYNIPELPVGVYTVTFEHPGFRKLKFVDVEAGDWADANPGCDAAGFGRRGARATSRPLRR